MRASGLVQVELVEDDEASTAPARPEHAGPWRGVTALLAVPLLAASTALGLQQVTDLATAVRLADVPGIAARIDGPLPVRWSTPGTWPVIEVGGTVIAPGPDAGQVRGIFATDGTVLWAREGHHERCRVVLDGAVVRPPVGTITRVRDDRASLLCQARQDTAASTTRLAVVDPTTGAERWSVTAPGAPRLSVVLDGDAVLLTLADDGHLAGLRWSLDDGVTRWTYRSQDGGFADEPITVAVELEARWAYVAGSRNVTLDLADGSERGAGVTARGEGAPLLRYDRLPAPVDLPGHGSAAQVVGEDGLPRVRATEADGSVRFEVAGVLAEPVTNDGSGPELLLVRSGGVLQGLDSTTGVARWTYPVGLTPVARLRGVVVATGVGVVAVIDLADGREAWQAPVDGVWAAQSVVTDGFVVVAGSVDAAGRQIVGRDLLTGDELWRTPAPEGVVSLAALSDGTLLAMSPGSLVALGG